MKYFLIYIFLEIAVSIPAFGELGVLGTFLEIIGSAILGVFLLQNTSYTLMESFNSLRENKISINAFKNISSLTLLGGFLLIIPGVLTDILGIVFQFSGLMSAFSVKFNKDNNIQENRSEKYEDVIDVEVIEHSYTK